MRTFGSFNQRYGAVTTNLRESRLPVSFKVNKKHYIHTISRPSTILKCVLKSNKNMWDQVSNISEIYT